MRPSREKRGALLFSFEKHILDYGVVVVSVIDFVRKSAPFHV